MTRGWCYTINNFTEEDRDGLRSLECVYNIFGYERGAEGTPHLQGYVHFKSHKTQQGVKKMMPRAHLEPRRDNRPSSGLLQKRRGLRRIRSQAIVTKREGQEE